MEYILLHFQQNEYLKNKEKSVARCKFCNQEITWLRDGRRSKPINSDGGVHACQEMKDSMKSIKKLETTDIDPELLKQYEAAINNKVNNTKK